MSKHRQEQTFFEYVTYALNQQYIVQMRIKICHDILTDIKI